VEARVKIAQTIILGVNEWCMLIDYWTYVHFFWNFHHESRSKTQASYLGIMYQMITRDGLHTGALAMRYTPKGETGHTGVAIRDSIVTELTELAELVKVHACV
jgi:hypothetical protein